MFDLQNSGARALELFEQSEEIVSERQAEEALSRVALDLEANLSGKLPILVTVMGGAVVFAGKLLPLLGFPLQSEFVSVGRYGHGPQGGELLWKSQPAFDAKGRTVVILDDILDEGVTLMLLRERFEQMGAKDVYCAVWFDKLCKAPRRKMQSDWFGMPLPDRFVFGCGMDIEGYWRNLPSVRALAP